MNIWYLKYTRDITKKENTKKETKDHKNMREIKIWILIRVHNDIYTLITNNFVDWGISGQKTVQSVKMSKRMWMFGNTHFMFESKTWKFAEKYTTGHYRIVSSGEFSLANRGKMWQNGGGQKLGKSGVG